MSCPNAKECPGLTGEMYNAPCKKCGCVEFGHCTYSSGLPNRFRKSARDDKMCDSCDGRCRGLCAKIKSECSKCGRTDSQGFGQLAYHKNRVVAAFKCLHCNTINYGN